MATRPSAVSRTTGEVGSYCASRGAGVSITVNLDKLIRLLIEDKHANPSNYALVVLSEGAEWEGYEVGEYGEPDAYGPARRRACPSRWPTKSSSAPGRRR